MSTNEPTGVLYAMTVTVESESHLLGVTPPEWKAAIVAAIVFGIAWELCMAMTRRITKRLPFLVLRLARLGMSRDEWKQSYEGEWKPELHAFLTESGRGSVGRFLQAMSFAVPLAVGGARMTAVAKRQSRRRLRDWARNVQRRTLLRVAGGMLSFAVGVEAAAAILGMSESNRLVIIAFIEALVLPLLVRAHYLILAERRRRRAASKK